MVSSCCRLSKKAKYEKRIAVTVFSFPPDKGNVGTAAYLNVFGSIHKVLKVNAFCSVISASDTCAAVICAECRLAALPAGMLSAYALVRNLAVPESLGSTVQLACLEPP